jgi:hypothetical protein
MNLRSLLAAILVLGICSNAVAADLYGTVRNSLDDQPVEGVEVRVEADGETFATETSDDGFFYLNPPDARSFDIQLEYDGVTTTWRNQATGEWLELQILAGDPGESDLDGLGLPGAPSGVEQAPARILKSTDYAFTTLPYPETIRVAMHVDDDCGEPIEEILEVPFEEYVEGVVYSEIGVFRSLDGGPDSASAVLRVFAVAARSYALWFYLSDPDASYHIDNTACNQRFEQVTAPSIAEAVQDTAGIIMTSATDADRLDKLEYAASCGRTDTLPEYGTVEDDLISDAISEDDRACVGSWCGHDNCAAHQTHPDYPDRGRCLVRGICQWGSAERSVRGEAWRDIIAHYQPNTQLTDLDAPMSARVVGFVREGSIDEGAGIPDATVRIGAETTTTNSNGYYEFTAIEVGDITVEVEATGYQNGSTSRTVQVGITNWASVALEPSEDTPDDLADVTDAADSNQCGPTDAVVRKEIGPIEAGETDSTPTDCDPAETTDLDTNTDTNPEPDTDNDDVADDTVDTEPAPDSSDEADSYDVAEEMPEAGTVDDTTEPGDSDAKSSASGGGCSSTNRAPHGALLAVLTLGIALTRRRVGQNQIRS